MFLVSRLVSKAPQVVATILIFSLSAGVLGGILFYMDSAGPDVLAEMTQDVPVDMYVSFRANFYSQNHTSVSDIEDIMKEQSAVIDTETLAVLEGYNREIEDWRDAFSVHIGVNESFFETFSDAISIVNGDTSLNSTTCMVERGRMTRYGFHIGDNATISVEAYNETSGDMYFVERNYTIVGSFTTSLFM
ncbi:MAG: hypothetical protein ACW974_11945, partial [Candidatus Thorarchaeota archaeon]